MDQTVRVPLALVQDLSVQRRDPYRPLWGLAIGVGAGGALGFSCGWGSQPETLGDPCGGWRHFEYAMYGAAVGGLLGFVIGGFSGGDRWVEIPLEQQRLSLMPRMDGSLALALAIAFQGVGSLLRVTDA